VAVLEAPAQREVLAPALVLIEEQQLRGKLVSATEMKRAIEQVLGQLLKRW